jgi:ribonuclease-3
MALARLSSPGAQASEEVASLQVRDGQGVSAGAILSRTDRAPFYRHHFNDPIGTATTCSARPFTHRLHQDVEESTASLRQRRCINSKRKVATLAQPSDLEQRLGVTFKNADFLQMALVHSSYVNENPAAAPESNERLEFLGDAVLGLAIADELFAAFPGQDEGKLTEMRAHLVRRDTLAQAAERMKLGDDLLLGRGEDEGGGRSRPTNLSHIYEALVGAIFLDQGLAPARDFVLRSLEDEIEAVKDAGSPLDAKSRLQELCQSQFQSTPIYELVESEGPDHAREFTVVAIVDGKTRGTGTGPSKQQAEKRAAREALRDLEQK